MSALDWLVAFLLTVSFELPIVLLLAPRGRRARAAGDACAANLLTHPCAWWAVLSAGAPWGLVEAAVLVVEAMVYRTVTGLRWPRAVATALLANGVTAAIGAML